MPKVGVPESVPFAARVTPDGRVPVSLKVIGLSPVAVTLKVPALFSAKVVEVPEVNTGGGKPTFKVKAWLVVFELTSVAVMVIG